MNKKKNKIVIYKGRSGCPKVFVVLILFSIPLFPKTELQMNQADVNPSQIVASSELISSLSVQCRVEEVSSVVSKKWRIVHTFDASNNEDS